MRKRTILGIFFLIVALFFARSVFLALTVPGWLDQVTVIASEVRGSNVSPGLFIPLNIFFVVVSGLISYLLFKSRR